MMKIPAIFCAMLVVACAPVTQVKLPLETRPASANAGKRIAAYCVAKSGQRVGNGECWTLADEAFKATGTYRPGSDMRVWGRRVERAKEPLKPGDVVEFESASFADRTMTGSAHTAVVVKGGRQQNISIAEQNWGKKTVRIRHLDLSGLRKGKVTVYRPE